MRLPNGSDLGHYEILGTGGTGQIYRARETRLGRDGLSQRQLLEPALPLTAAFAAAHEQVIVHRDLKPANCS